MTTLKQLKDLKAECRLWRVMPHDTAPVQIVDDTVFYVLVRDADTPSEWITLKGQRANEARAFTTLQAAYNSVRDGMDWQGTIELRKQK